MKAQLKCSNCGAEISNLNMSWGRRQWVWFIPFVALMFSLPLLVNHLMRGEKRDFGSDLIIKDVERRYVSGSIEILGTIENRGQVGWQSVALKAELFDKEGKFLDVVSSRIALHISAGDSEHFKIAAKDFPTSRWEAIKDMRVKVADAYHQPF